MVPLVLTRLITIPYWMVGSQIRGRGVCIHGRYVSFMLTLAWAQYLYTNSGAFRKNISTCWSKADIKSKYTFLIHEFRVLARKVLVQSSSSSGARSKRVMNQTMFNVPDPFVVHVLLLTFEFMYNNICLPHFWYPQCGNPCFLCAPNTQMIPLFDLMRSAGPGRCLIIFTGFIQCCDVKTAALCLFSLSKLLL
jgi:hypothetical protein